MCLYGFVITNGEKSRRVNAPKYEEFNVDKLVQRTDNLCFDLDSHSMKPFKVLEKLLLNLDLEISTTDLDTLLMDAASSFIEFHQDYATLVDRYVHS